MCDKLARRKLRTSLIGDDRPGALAAGRRQLVDALQAEGCRLGAAALPAVRASLEAVIAVLRQSLDALEAELADAISADPQMAELAKLLQTIRGIGPVVALTQIADLPELSLLSAKQIAALVGLAPHPLQFRSCRPASSLALQRLLHPARHRQPTPRDGRPHRRDAQNPDHRQRCRQRSRALV
jgi:transposase